LPVYERSSRSAKSAVNSSRSAGVRACQCSPSARRAVSEKSNALSKLGSVENADDPVDLRLQLFRRHPGARRRRCCEQDHGEARHHDTSHVGKTRDGARSVRRFYPRANPADWCLEVAGQRVQILVFHPPASFGRAVLPRGRHSAARAGDVNVR